MPEVGPAVMARAVRGDDHAFATVINHYDHILRTFTCQFIGDTAPMDEALTEAYVRAYRLLPAYRAETRPSTWLLRIVYHAGLNAMASPDDGGSDQAAGDGGNGGSAGDAGGGGGGGGARDEPGRGSAAEAGARGASDAVGAGGEGSGQLALWLDEALAQLPSERRAAVLLVDGVGTDASSAADVLGITVEELGDWLAGARPDLRAVIAAGGEGRRP